MFDTIEVNELEVIEDAELDAVAGGQDTIFQFNSSNTFGVGVGQTNGSSTLAIGLGLLVLNF
jgi:hypothetical protein